MPSLGEIERRIREIESSKMAEDHRMVSTIIMAGEEETVYMVVK
jgi:hypothetical protein